MDAIKTFRGSDRTAAEISGNLSITLGIIQYYSVRIGTYNNIHNIYK